MNLGAAFNSGRRRLIGKECSCLGISYEGYKYISNVKKEIEKEAGLKSVDIECSSYKFYLIFIRVLILLSLLIKIW